MVNSSLPRFGRLPNVRTYASTSHERKAQYELSTFSEDHIRFLADSLPEIVWTAFPNGQVDYMNRRWFEYTGLTEEETYTEKKTAVHPDDFTAYKARWKESILTGQPYEMAYRFRRASDGMYRWHIGRAVALRDERGRILRWFGTCVDIHAQKEAEDQIRLLNEDLESIVAKRTKHLEKEIRQRKRAEHHHQTHAQMLHNIIETFPMAAVAIDSRGALLHANEKFYNLCAVPRETTEFSGPRYLNMGSILERRFPSPECENFARNVLGNDKTVRQEISTSGETFRFKYFPAADGTLERDYVLLIQNISEEKKIDAAKSEFMSLASHQLRTPLTAIRWALGRLSRILKGRLSEPEDQLLDRALKSAKTMSETIRTMLSISQIEAGLHPVKTSDIRLGYFLQNIADDSAETLAARRLTIAIQCPKNLWVHTDPGLLREIIDNLLANAIKYTPTGGSITLMAEENEGKILIRIRDTGYGIPAHQHKNIFSKFFRGDNIVTVDTEGTGLGLYLVSQLTRTLGGTITFTSEEGKGTEFVLALPNK